MAPRAYDCASIFAADRAMQIFIGKSRDLSELLRGQKPGDEHQHSGGSTILQRLGQKTGNQTEGPGDSL